MEKEVIVKVLEKTTREKWVAEYKFCETRKWKFDFACVEKKLAIELEGIKPNGISRHRTPQGYIADLEKYNDAVLNGWRVLRFTPNYIKMKVRKLKNGEIKYSPNMYWADNLNKIFSATKKEK